MKNRNNEEELKEEYNKKNRIKKRKSKTEINWKEK